jgi:hypothetical protein
MGNCSYCHKPAGLLRKIHNECVDKYERGRHEIISFSKEAAIKDDEYNAVMIKLSSIAEQSFISEGMIRGLMIAGWEEVVEEFFEDGILSKDEEDKLVCFSKKFSLGQNDLDQNGYYSKIVKGAVLRDVLEGIIPSRLKLSGQLPFNFQKDEKLVWVFQPVDYYELRTKRQYVGSYQGVSVKIMRGVYYRTGGFKGHPVEKSELQHVDNGLLAVTDRHIYFSGNFKNFRVNFNKIISIKSYSDGIEIQKDTSTAKPQSFVTGDGWFTYNLIVNLANIK